MNGHCQLYSLSYSNTRAVYFDCVSHLLASLYCFSYLSIHYVNGAVFASVVTAFKFYCCTGVTF